MVKKWTIYIKWCSCSFFSNNEKFIENEKKEHVKQNKEDSEPKEDIGILEDRCGWKSQKVEGGSKTFTNKELNELKENLLEYLEVREKVINNDYAIKEFMKKDSIRKTLQILLK